jgi:cell division protein FtsB
MARRTRTSIGREIYYIACVVVFIASAIFTIWGPGGFQDMKKNQRQLMERRQRVATLEKSNSERLQKIDGLKKDPTAIENEARQKGYARTGEIIQNVTPASRPGGSTKTR